MKIHRGADRKHWDSRPVPATKRTRLADEVMGNGREIESEWEPGVKDGTVWCAFEGLACIKTTRFLSWPWSSVPILSPHSSHLACPAHSQAAYTFLLKVLLYHSDYRPQTQGVLGRYSQGSQEFSTKKFFNAVLSLLGNSKKNRIFWITKSLLNDQIHDWKCRAKMGNQGWGRRNSGRLQEPVWAFHCSFIYKSQGMEAAMKKEWNFAMCNNVHRPNEWNKSDRERQVPYDVTYMWNLKNKINKLNRNRLRDTENILKVARWEDLRWRR